MPARDNSAISAREAAMRASVRAAVLQGTRWYDGTELAAHALVGGPMADPGTWKRAGQIFALSLEGEDHFPAYGVDPVTWQPVPALQDVLAILSATRDAWGVAAWFEAVNSYLGGKRPRELLAVDPDRVVWAAREDIMPVAHA